MLKILLSVWNIMTAVLVWGTFAAALTAFAWAVKKIAAKKASVRHWAAAAALLSFAVLFLVFRVRSPEMFRMAGGVAMLAVATISTQVQKYKDRREGRRWWTQ